MGQQFYVGFDFLSRFFSLQKRTPSVSGPKPLDLRSITEQKKSMIHLHIVHGEPTQYGV